MIESSDLVNIPGAELILEGISQLKRQELGVEGLLVLIAQENLRSLGFIFDAPLTSVEPYEHLLYALLEDSFGSEAHSRYNALIARIVSFRRALEGCISRERRLRGL